MRCIFLALTAFALATTAVIAQNVKIQPVPAWVVPHEPDLKAVPAADESGGYYYQLIDTQENLALKESFVHYAYTFLTTEGVQEMADLSVDFDPAYQTLAFHELVIHRGGKVINKLHARDLHTIQREQSMDRYLYDGSLSVVLNVQDVRVGDVLEYSFTRKGTNPVFNGHYSEWIYFDLNVAYDKLHRRLVFPTEKKMYAKYFNGEVKPDIQQKGKLTEYIWTLAHGKQFSGDDNQPYWFETNRSVALTDFENWADVAQWAHEHFRVSPTEREALKKYLDGQFDGTRKDEILQKAIRFVQDEVRYLGFESGRNSHKPHSPLSVYEQRFGDCKDKSLLLCTILQQYDIEAYPMLVNTSLRGHTSEQLPAANIFDHCVVEVWHEGKPLYVDPTISNQGGTLGGLYFPSYGEGLIIRDTTTTLVKLPLPVPSEVTEEQTFTMEDHAGSANLTVRTTYTGNEADRQRSDFASSTLSGTQKSYLDFYANNYPDIEVADTLTITDNREENTFVVLEKYKIPTFWKPDGADASKKLGDFYAQTMKTYFNISKSSNRSTPYRLTYPLNFHHRIRAHLTGAWNLTTNDEQINTPYYQYAYAVRYNKKDNELQIDTDYKTLTDHVPVEALKEFVKDHDIMSNKVWYGLTWGGVAEAAAPGSDVSGGAIVAAILLLAASLWFAQKLFYEYDPEPQVWVEEGRPIGGWLILIGFSIVFTPLRAGYVFLVTSDFFSREIYDLNTIYLGYGYLAMIKLAYNVVIIVFATLLIILFFARRTSVPHLFKIFYGMNLSMIVLNSIAGIHDTPDHAKQHYYNVFFAIFVTGILIPYFNSSTRVKETFVVRSKDTNWWR
jgi:transglutaminase-like putative cysteine protease